MRINILDQSVYNRIAAGEVVENPASVVKELVENSIDAGATQIEIRISQGGIRSIGVTDNGCGILKEELHKVIFPHATSKIASVSDLDSIATLGFRGEAVASIAAVSEIEIKTRYFQSEFGAKLTAKGGESINISDTAYNQGTSILISNLFYNTPARYKFLKGAKSEEAYITKAVSQLILANSHIAFKYFADDKKIYESDGSGLDGAAKAVFSADIYDKLLPIVEDESASIRVSGLMSEPSLGKNNRNYQTIILNGRVITDINISSVVSNAYGGRLMTHAFPAFVLNIVMPFDEVDVNVHPNKREVRFANPRQVYGAIYNAVKNTLEAFEAQALARLYPPKPISEISAEPQPLHPESEEKPKTFTSPAYAKPGNDLFGVAYYLERLKGTTENGTLKVAENNDFPPIKDIFSSKTKIGEQSEAKPNIAEVAADIQPEAKMKTAEAPKNYKVLGQVFDTYIVLEYNGELLIIDQHAAHERLLFDKLSEAVNTDEAASQPLLIPYIYEDSPVRIAEILSLSGEINKLGFEIEGFGNNTIKINAVPQALTDMDIGAFLSDIIDGIKFREFSGSDIIIENLIKKACKSAIKGGYSYNLEQSEKIIEYFFASGMPLQCPHGRPTYISFTKAEIEKLFRRKL